MKVHGLIAFSTGADLSESRATTLDLDLATRLLLDMLDISAALTNNLCTKVKSWDGLEVDRNAFFGPFALGKLAS